MASSEYSPLNHSNDDNDVLIDDKSQLHEAMTEQGIDIDDGLREIPMNTSTISKRKTGPPARHQIWEYFRDVEGGVQCILCQTSFKGKFTTNAERHLRRHHKNKVTEYVKKKGDYDKALKKKRDVDEIQLESNQLYSNHQLRQLAVYIASTSVPYSIIDTAEFKDFCQSLVPNFALPDKKTVLKEISAIYSEMKTNILKSLETAGRISICVDEWTKEGMMLSVIGITAHFFNRKTHNLERILLAIRKIEHPHTVEHISLLTNSILNEWNISEEKVWRIITDNARNITKAFQMVSLDSDVNLNILVVTNEPTVNRRVIENLEESFDEDAADQYVDDIEIFEATFNRQKHLPCFIHTLVLAFKKAVDSTAEDNRDVLRVKLDALRLVAYFSKSSKAMERLKEICGRKLLMPARTRWNYHYEMMQRLVDMRQHVMRVCEEQDIKNVFNWGILVQLIQVLKPFAKWIDYLQGQKYSTITYALPCLIELLEHLQDMKTKKILISLCDEIIYWIRFHFKYILFLDDANFNSTFVIATFLHPTLALSLDESQLSRARRELQILLQIECKLSPFGQRSQSTNSQLFMDIEEDLCGGLFPHLQQKILKAKHVGTPTISPLEEEINTYFKQLPNYPNIADPFTFWIDHETLFPTLSKTACDILTIPVSSAAVESVFSVAGHAASGRRHNFSSVNLEKEVMIKVNKKFL